MKTQGIGRKFRILFYIVLAVGIGAALLPWYLPTGWISRKIEGQMSEQLGRHVRIGSLSVRWDRGIEIRNLEIGAREGFGDWPTAKAGYIHCPISIGGFLKNRLGDVLIQDAEAAVVERADGRLSVDDLPERLEKRDEEAMEVAGVHVDAAKVRWIRMGADGKARKEAAWEMGACEFLRDETTGAMRWAVQAGAEGSAAPTLVSRGEIGQAGANTAYFAINKADLSALPVEAVLSAMREAQRWHGKEGFASKVESVKGFVSAHAEARMGAGGRVEMTGNMQIEGVEAAGNGQTLLAGGEWSMQFAGGYDPATARVELTECRGNGMGAELDCRGRYDPRAGAKETLEIEVKKLRMEPAKLEAAAPAVTNHPVHEGLAIVQEGILEIEGAYRSNEERQRVEWKLEGTDWGVIMLGLSKRRGEAFGISLESEYQWKTGGLSVKPIRVQWRSMTGEGEVCVADGAGGLAGVASRLKEAQWEGNLKIGEFEDLLGSCEHLLFMAPGLHVSGPVEAQAKMTGTGIGREFSGKAAFPKGSRFWVEDVKAETKRIAFTKEAETALTAVVRGEPDGLGGAESVEFEARMGDSAIMLEKGRVRRKKDGSGVGECSGSWRVEGAEGWLAALPDVKKALEQRGILAAGNSSGDVRYYEEEDKRGVEFAADAGGMGVRVIRGKEDVFRKEQGQKLMIQWRQEGDGGTVRFSSHAESEAWRADAEGRAKRMDNKNGKGMFVPEEVRFGVGSKQLEKMGENWPGVFGDSGVKFGGNRLAGLKGKAEMNGTVYFENQGAQGQFSVEAGGSEFVWSRLMGQTEEVLWKKAAGTVCHVKGRAGMNHQVDAARLLFLGMLGPGNQASVTVEDVHAKVCGSTADCGGHFMLSGEADGDVLGMCSEAEFQVRVLLDHGDALGTECPKIGRQRERMELGGRTAMEGWAKWTAAEKRLGWRGKVDLQETAFRAAVERKGQAAPLVIRKPSGNLLRISAEGETINNFSEIHLHAAKAEALDAIVTGRGTITRGATGAIEKGQVHVEAEATGAGKCLRWLDGWADYKAEGNWRGAADVRFATGPAWEAEVLHAEASGKGRWNVKGEEIRASLEALKGEAGELTFSGLDVQVDKNDLMLTGEIQMPVLSGNMLHGPERLKGRVDAWSDGLDLDDVQRRLRVLGIGAGTAAAAAGAEAETVTMGVSEISAWMRKLELEGTAGATWVSYSDARTGARLRLEEFRNDYALKEGKLGAEFRASLNGGVIQGQVACDGTAEGMPMEFTLRSEKLRADANLRPMVESEFPGMVVTGFISEQYTIRNTVENLLKGSSEGEGPGITICEEGVLYGPGGPAWMLTVFPGLKLVEYPWKTMTNTFDRLADGRKKNHMIFKGQDYDIFLDGVSTPVAEEKEYNEVMELLEREYETVRDVNEKLKTGEMTVSEQKARHLWYCFEGLGKLRQRKARGERLPVTQIDYNVGAVVSRSGKELFDKPRTILPIPVFRTRGYVIGQFMVGLETTNTPLF